MSGRSSFIDHRAPCRPFLVMSKFNPDFWEVTLSQESWRQFSTEDSLHHEEPAEREERHEREEQAKAIMPAIRPWRITSAARRQGS